MTVEFRMADVHVGPRIVASTILACDLLVRLGYPVENKGTAGDRIDGADFIERAVKLRPKRGRNRPTTDPPASELVQLALDVAKLCEAALASGRRYIQWCP